MFEEVVQLKDEEWKVTNKKNKKEEEEEETLGGFLTDFEGIIDRMFILKRKVENNMPCMIPGRIPRRILQNPPMVSQKLLWCW